MGLDLFNESTDEWFNVGSYSGVHSIRIAMIKAAILYLESLKVDEDKDSCVGKALYELQLWKCSNNTLFTMPMDINYKYISDRCNDSIIRCGLCGLFVWVSHSDCDGFFSSGNCKDVVETISKIMPFIEQSLQEFVRDLASFLKTAAEQGSVVTFS